MKSILSSKSVVAVTVHVRNLYDTGIDGTAHKITVMGQTDLITSDIAAFRNASGLPANEPTVILVPGSPDLDLTIINVTDYPERPSDSRQRRW